MKAERVQFRFSPLEGWVLEKAPSQTLGLRGQKEEPEALWTVFEMADHLEACELVRELGQIADRTCACPEIDVRLNLVFVRVHTPEKGLTEEDFDFAEAVDREIGNGQKASGLVN